MGSEAFPSWRGGGYAGGEGSPAENGPVPEMTSAHTLPERPQRILVADDEHLVASELVFQLADMGYTIVGPVTDGKAALELCRVALPDMALLDVKMPVMSGLEAAERVYVELGIPVVILSAFAGKKEIVAAGDAGVFGYQVKPASDQQLRATIEVAWKKFREQAEQASENAELRKRLNDRKLVEQAKWILVRRRSIDEAGALRVLQEQSRNTRRPMVEIARSIVEADSLLGGAEGKAGA